MVAYAVVRSVEPHDLRRVVALHIEALGDRSTLTMLGPEPLSLVYRSILAAGIGYLALARQSKEIVGFALVCTDTRRLGSVLARNAIPLTWSSTRAILRRPYLILKLVEAAFYERRAATHVPAELLVIAVAPQQRSQGIGARLLHDIRAELARCGIDRYVVTVHEAMTAADRFYAGNGLRLMRRFRMYGVTWNAYLDEHLTTAPPLGS